MQDVLQPRKSVAITQHRTTQRATVNRAIQDSARKRRRYQLDRSATPRLHSMHREVSVEYRNVCSAKSRGGSRFPHANASGEADDPHLALCRQQIGSNEATKVLVHHRVHPKPGAETGHGLMQQHAQTLDTADVASTGGSK